MARFLEHYRDQNAPRTTARYTSASKPLIKVFGAKQLHAITPDDVEKFKTERMKREEKNRAPVSVNGDLACLSALYTYFVSLEVIAVNPVSRVNFLPVDNAV